MLRLLLFAFAVSTVVPVVAQTNGAIPPVLLSEQEKLEALVGVGATLPAASLPVVGGTASQGIVEKLGRAATVVVWYGPETRQSKTLLRDITPFVVTPFAKRGVEVIAVAVGDDPQAEAVKKLGYAGPILHDAAGEAFAKVGKDSLPRVYVLDKAGKVVWFDIEYSESTRRELLQTLKSLVPAQ